METRFWFCQGIEPEDAVYFPAVETALSLVHDVHPRVGESVAVFGQGMIGYVSQSVSPPPLPPPQTPEKLAVYVVRKFSFGRLS